MADKTGSINAGTDGVPVTYELMEPQLAALYDTTGSGQLPPLTSKDLTTWQLARRLLFEPVVAIVPAVLLFALIPVMVSDADLLRTSFGVGELLRAHGWFFLVFNPACCLLGWSWINTVLVEYVGNTEHMADVWLYVIGYTATAATGVFGTAMFGFIRYGNLFAISVMLVVCLPRMYYRLPATLRADASGPQMTRFWLFWKCFVVGSVVVLFSSFYMMGMMWITSADGTHSMWSQLALALSFRVANKLARVVLGHMYRDDPLMVVLISVLWAEQMVSLYLYLAYPAIGKWVLTFGLLLLQTLFNSLQYWLIGDSGMEWRTNWKLPYTWPTHCTTTSERATFYRTEVSHRHFLSLWIQVITCVFFLLLTLSLRYGLSSSATPFGCYSAQQYGLAVAFVACTIAAVSVDALFWLRYVHTHYAIDAVRTLVWELQARPLTVFTTSLVVAVLPLMILFKPYNVMVLPCAIGM